MCGEHLPWRYPLERHGVRFLQDVIVETCHQHYRMRSLESQSQVHSAIHGANRADKKAPWPQEIRAEGAFISQIIRRPVTGPDLVPETAGKSGYLDATCSEGVTLKPKATAVT
jgi:hypothetical protein